MLSALNLFIAQLLPENKIKLGKHQQMLFN